MITELFSENPLLLKYLCQSMICIALGVLASFILRHRAARAHQALLLGVLAAVILPLMSFTVKHYQWGLLTAQPVTAQATAAQPHVDMLPIQINYQFPLPPPVENTAYELAAVEEHVSSSVVTAPTTPFPWKSFLLWTWIAAGLILLSRLIVTFILGARLAAKAQKLTCPQIEKAVQLAKQKLRLFRTIELKAADSVASPVIWSWARRPILLVPGDTEYFDDSIDWTSVFCHELAHCKRRDHLTGLVAELVLCVLPWNPLMWWAKSRLVALSEQACDDWVVAAGQSGPDYANSLLDLVPHAQMAFVPTVVARKKKLATRVRRILDDRCANPRAGLRWALLVTILALCTALTVAFAQTRPAHTGEYHLEQYEESGPSTPAETEEYEQLREQALLREKEKISTHEDLQRSESELYTAELNRLLNSLQYRAQFIERQLTLLPEDRNTGAQQLQAELRDIRERIRDVEQQLNEHSLRQFQQFTESALSRLNIDDRTRQLLDERRALLQRLHRLEDQFKQHGQEEAARSCAQLQQMRDRIAYIESRLQHQDRDPLKAGRATPRHTDGRRRQLIKQRDDLRRHEEEIERNVEALKDQDSQQARHLLTELDKTRDLLLSIEAELRRSEPGLPTLGRQMTSDPQTDPFIQPPPPIPPQEHYADDYTLNRRKTSEPEPSTEHLFSEYRSLLDQAGKIEDQLLVHPDAETGSTLSSQQLQLKDIRLRISNIEKILLDRDRRQQERAKLDRLRDLLDDLIQQQSPHGETMPPEHQTYEPWRTPPYPQDPGTTRPRVQAQLENQVHELRSEVKTLRREILQLRQLLQQLMEAKTKPAGIEGLHLKSPPPAPPADLDPSELRPKDTPSPTEQETLEPELQDTPLPP